jgi:hypothetical protein
MGFLTRLDQPGAFSLNPKNSAKGLKQFGISPTGAGRSLRPDGCPKKPIMPLKEVMQRSQDVLLMGIPKVKANQ